MPGMSFGPVLPLSSIHFVKSFHDNGVTGFCLRYKRDKTRLSLMGTSITGKAKWRGSVSRPRVILRGSWMMPSAPYILRASCVVERVHVF